MSAAYSSSAAIAAAHAEGLEYAAVEVYLRKWGSSFGKIDDSSWLILNKAILKRLALGETEVQADDYVNRAEGVLYRVRELEDQEPRPAISLVPKGDKTVRPTYQLWNGEYVEYHVGAAGRLKLMSVKRPDTPREHENIAFAASKNPSFKLPKPLYHTEADGKYAIFCEAFGRRWMPHNLPVSASRKIVHQVLDAVVEMASWEASSISGVNGKAPTYKVFEKVLMTKEDINHHDVAKNLEEFFGKKGFTLAPFSFCLPQMDHQWIGIDANNNFVGFHDWSQCAFAPKGYIMGQVVSEARAWTPPPKELPWLQHDAVARTAAVIGLGLQGRGFPNELDLWEDVSREMDDDVARERAGEPRLRLSEYFLDRDLDCKEYFKA